MKKLLILPVLILLFSCSAEDEASSDPIVGNWRLVKALSFPENGDPVETEFSECGKKESMSFKNNGELYSVHYYLNEIMECKLNELGTGIYRWTKVSESIYNLKSVSPEGRDYKFSFPDDNTMWMYTAGPYEVEGVKYSAQVYVYKRT